MSFYEYLQETHVEDPLLEVKANKALNIVHSIIHRLLHVVGPCRFQQGGVGQVNNFNV